LAPSQFLTIRREGPVEHVTLNRPEVRNALDDELISELTQWAGRIAARDVRCVVLAGAGAVFCAGADLAWMSRIASFTPEENRNDLEAAARLFATIDTLPVPVIGRIHGAALGGGAGLAAVCDIVVAEQSTVFGFTEVKLGIVPAIISPYVLAKIGRSAARELFLTGMRFGAVRAQQIGLVHAVVPLDRLDSTVAEYVQEILASGPEATAVAKALIPDVWDRRGPDTSSKTVDTLLERRTSTEGLEGMRAFLEKRKAAWNAGR
jgi:methylglutaconyl-CoA hydratase